jgi:dTDP-4-amino-4,6-dideoxygalactose transaminase
VDFFSYNSRLDSVQAVVGLNFLSLLEQTTHRRKSNAEKYDELLEDSGEWVTRPQTTSNASHVFHVYQVRAKDRDRLKAYLADMGVDTKIHYPIPIHEQKAAQYLGYKRGDFPVTETLASEILSLPIRENLKASEIEYICEMVRNFYKKT